MSVTPDQFNEMEARTEKARKKPISKFPDENDLLMWERKLGKAGWVEYQPGEWSDPTTGEHYRTATAYMVLQQLESAQKRGEKEAARKKPASETVLEKAGWRRIGTDEWTSPDTGNHFPTWVAVKIAAGELDKRDRIAMKDNDVTILSGRPTAITPAEKDILAKLNEQKETGSVEDEIRDLHKPIIKFCRGKGWIYFYSNPRRKTGRTIGEPDFTILADNARVFFIECKARGERLSPGQWILHSAAARLGHSIYTIYTMDEFYGLVK